MGRHLVAVVAPNGVGHLRRVVGVLHTLLGLHPDLEVDVVCEDWQVRHLEDWVSARALWERGSRKVTGLMEPGVQWATDPAVFDDGRLLAWEARIADSGVLVDADLVVSDNLAGVLALRPDTVLMGSFLWSDVLARAHPADPMVNAFVRQEQDLLARYRPPMLCVADMVMPGVTSRTAAVPLPWMCEAPPMPRDANCRVGVLGGRTGAIQDLLDGVAGALAQEGFEVAVPDASGDTTGSCQRFGFSAEEFAASDVVVCRPGMGTVTDCVGQRVPMVVLYEAGNVELAHNAARLADLGIARNLGAEPAVDTVVEAVCTVLEARDSEIGAAAMRGRIETLATDGLEQAAEWLAARMETSAQRQRREQLRKAAS